METAVAFADPEEHIAVRLCRRIGGPDCRAPAFALPAQNVSMASAGGGVRVGVGKGWSTSVEVAVPLERPSVAYNNKPRVFFGITRVI